MSSQVLDPTQKLNHSDGQAKKFYRDLKQRGISVRVGLEATGYSGWFERLLAELGIGDPAQIKAKRVKKQKTDRNGARLLCGLMREITSRRSGYRVPRIEIYGNCCGTGIAWCRCARAS
jgi:transposase